jgi:alpha-L-fucosidase 2
MIQDCSQNGAVTAKTYYNCPGWVLHHNTDLWRVLRQSRSTMASGHRRSLLCQHLCGNMISPGTRNSEKPAYPLSKVRPNFSPLFVEDPRNRIAGSFRPVEFS